MTDILIKYLDSTRDKRNEIKMKAQSYVELTKHLKYASGISGKLQEKINDVFKSEKKTSSYKPFPEVKRRDNGQVFAMNGVALGICSCKSLRDLSSNQEVYSFEKRSRLKNRMSIGDRIIRYNGIEPFKKIYQLSK